MNPFSNSKSNDTIDKDLIKKILDGDKQAINALINRHQAYIYNIAWKMVGNEVDAADLSQEAMIKIVSKLEQFNFNSSFRTWAYRIVRNHFLNDQKKSSKQIASNFVELSQALDAIPNIELSQEEKLEKEEVTKEIRLTCLSGMLLCLTKEQRMIFIIGELFRADHVIGAEIMEISKANFRMKLSKARKDLINFMKNKCGLIDKSNPCRCHKKVTVSIEAQIIDAKNLLYNRKEFSTFRAQLEQDANYLVDESEIKYMELHGNHSFKTRFDKKEFLTQLLEENAWKNRLNLN
jgi:RNA polymerase sigma factor (sigma-70 family)